jgi:hypothetical protein
VERWRSPLIIKGKIILIMKLGKLKERLSDFKDDDRDVVLFANGYKELQVSNHDDGIVIWGKGKICPSIRTAIENAGAESKPEDECSPCIYHSSGTIMNDNFDTGE